MSGNKYYIYNKHIVCRLLQNGKMDWQVEAVV